MEREEKKTKEVKKVKKLNIKFPCPICKKKFSEDKLWNHVPFEHGRLPRIEAQCPICDVNSSNFAVHLHDEHGPCGRDLTWKSKNIINKHVQFSLVIVRHPEMMKYVLVDEPASWGWWLPAGRVDAGESFVEAALRETREEAGIEVILEGIIRFELDPVLCRQRVIFVARPKNNTALKSIPDFESQGAKWASFAEIKEHKNKGQLRGMEAYTWTKYLEQGGPVYPLHILVDAEGRPAFNFKQV